MRVIAARLIVAPLLVTVMLGGRPVHADDAPPPLSKPPRLKRFVPASAPAELATRRQVEVVLVIDVNVAGAVDRVEVVGSGGPEFDAAAVGAARGFAFEPGEAGGKPVPVRVTYRYRFFLTPASQPASRPARQAATGPSWRTIVRVPGFATVPVRGRVLKRGEGGVPLVGVRVYLDDGAQVASTDAKGRFGFAAVPAGGHTLKVRGSEVAPTDAAITARAGKELQVTIFVAALEPYTSVVRGRRVVPEVVEQNLQIEEIKRIPGTQGDTLKAVQNLAGVARAPFILGFLVVWGSSPSDTRVYLDDVRIPALYHLGALRSTVNSESIQSLTFLPGGYGAAHGRGLGGVIQVQTRPPRTDGLHGFVQLDLMDGAIGIEGPLTRNLAVGASVRRSWIDVFLPLFTTSDFQLSPKYYDYQARLRWQASPRDIIDATVFGSDDSMTLKLKRPDPTLAGQFDSHSYFHRALASWQHRFAGGATLTVTPSLGYEVPAQVSAVMGNTTISVDAKSLGYTLRAVFRTELTRHLKLETGFDFEGSRNPVSLTVPVGSSGEGGGGGGGGGGGDDEVGGSGAPAIASDAATLYSTSASPFAALTISALRNRLTIAPQIRLETFAFSAYAGTPDAFSHGFVKVEPRVIVRYQLLRWLAAKAAFGYYHQPPELMSFSRTFGNPNVGLESGLHYVAGFDLKPTSTLRIEAQGFYKDLRDLVVRGANAGDPLAQNADRGRVYGGDLLVRQELSRNFFGWIAYTLSRSERKDHPDEPWRLFRFDQTHILTAVGSYKLPRGYQVGLRFRLVSGNPYTPVVGSYYDAGALRFRPLSGDPFSARLKLFHQLDLRFDKTWTFNRWRFSVYLDIQNLYYSTSQEGIAYNFDYTKSAPVSGLPLLPIFGVRGDF